MLYWYVQVVLGLCRLCYDESTIRRDTLGSVNNGNRLFAAQSAAVRSLLEIATAQGSTAFNFLSIAKGKPIRTLVELNEAGYTVRDSVKDPFSKRDAIAVLKAVQR